MNRSFPLSLLLGGALFSIQPAAGHCYRYWHFRQPQTGCNTNTPDFASGVRDRRPLSRDIPSAVPLKDHSWYVEMVTPPQAAPLEADQRTPAEIRDFDEHYEAVAKYHDEINRQMIILHAREDAERAAGIEGAR